MLRVVLAVLLAAALVGVGTTALGEVRRERAHELVDGETADLADAIENLARTEAATARRADAARRVLAVGVPTGSPTTAPVEYVSLGGVPGRAVPGDDRSRDVVAYQVRGGEPRLRWLPVDVRLPGRDGLRPDDDALVLERPAQLVLSLVRRAGRAVVLARRR